LTSKINIFFSKHDLFFNTWWGDGGRVVFFPWDSIINGRGGKLLKRWKLENGKHWKLENLKT
jgi:hypothetical protein